ncbi:MAG: coproporphyrinogen-III oxidase family protein [Planctomycetota bacterium]|jgi:oxygen-independent coproporphyrinogen-3 oxidase
MKSASSNAGLYIHIPYCQKKCPYCAFYSEPIEQHKPEALIDALFMELERYAVTEPLETIYIGGGSPTCLPGYLLTETVVSLVSQYKDAAEFTIECNPAQANETTLKQLRTLGVNRLSIGAQSFDANELKTLGRIHSPEQIAEAVRAGKAAGFDNIGLDLIFGVPGSTMDTWRYSLECAAALDVQHISAYSLTIEKATPFDRVFRAGQLAMIDEAAEREMYEIAREGVLNFFSTKSPTSHSPALSASTICGIGKIWRLLVSAPPRQGGTRASGPPTSRTSPHILKKHTEEHAPAPEQIACETAVLGLRMTNGIDMHEFEKQTGFDLIMLFGSAIKQHCASGLLECTADNHCRLTEKGFSYADTVAGDFASLD